MSKNFIFSSESVGEGHPDKVCDTISDAVLDACLAQDPRSRVACETYAKSNLVVVGGELTTIRKSGKVKWLRPDAKTQVSVRYANDQPVEIINVVISTQHAHDVKHDTIKEFCIEEVIQKTLPQHLLTKNTTFLINPTG